MPFGNQHQPVVGRLIHESARHGKAKLQRHIEPSQIRISLAAVARQIVNRILRPEHCLTNSIDSGIRDRPAFDCASRCESTGDSGEYDGIQQRSILRIERTVDENRSLRLWIPMSRQESAWVEICSKDWFNRLGAQGF